MNKTIFKFAPAIPIFLLLGALNLKSQEAFDLGSVGASDIKAAIPSGQDIRSSPAVPDKPGPQARKEWTVMVFMNAKNNLSQSALMGLGGKWAQKNLAEMRKVGSTGKVNVVVEYGATGKGSRRMLIGKGGLFTAGETVYGQYPDADMGDYKRVVNFAKWAKANFPARKYMFILSNHGSGWVDPARGSAARPSDKGILFDDETRNYVRTRQLGEILRQTGYVDVFAMDACLMQMAEVAYEVKDNAGLIVASEEVSLAQGFDYDKLLDFLNAQPGATDEQLSDFFIRSCRDFYTNGDFLGTFGMPPGTLSAVRGRALDRLPAYLHSFAGAVMDQRETQAVKSAVENVIRFSNPLGGDKKKMLAPYIDLYDFVRIVHANAASREARQAAENLMTFIKSELVVRSFGGRRDKENGHEYSAVGGIAINMAVKTRLSPEWQDALAGASETKYSDLALSRASRWDKFVAWTDSVLRK